jgi:hypothetical protein
LQIFPRARTGINKISRAQFFKCVRVKIMPLTLHVRPERSGVVGAFVPGEAEPPGTFVHIRQKLGARTGRIEVFDAQNQDTIAGAGALLGSPKGAGMTEMQQAGRGGREPAAIGLSNLYR